MLLSHGADPNLKDLENRSVIQNAFAARNEALATFLLQRKDVKWVRSMQTTL